MPKTRSNDIAQHLRWMIEGAEEVLRQHRTCLVETAAVKRLHLRTANAKVALEKLNESTRTHLKPT